MSRLSWEGSGSWYEQRHWPACTAYHASQWTVSSFLLFWKWTVRAGRGGQGHCAIAFTFLNKPLCKKELMTFYLEQRASTEGRAHSHSLPSTLWSHTVFLMGPLSSPTLVPPWNAVAKLSGRGRPRCAARRWCWLVLCHHGYSGTLFSASVDYHLADLSLPQEQRK